MEILPIPLCAPVTNTMSHENASTTMVRSAVATLESVFLIPHFAKIAVRPANKAEPNANIIHILGSLLGCICRNFSLIIPQKQPFPAMRCEGCLNPAGNGCVSLHFIYFLSTILVLLLHLSTSAKFCNQKRKSTNNNEGKYHTRYR